MTSQQIADLMLAEDQERRARLKEIASRFDELIGQFMAPPFETVQERVAEIMAAG